MLGGFNWLQDRIGWIKVETKNSVHFIQFLDHLLIQQFLTGRVVIVMDYVSFCKSAPAFAALSLYELRVTVMWLPTYCSDLNPIERSWLYFKDLACTNKLQSGIEIVLCASNKILTEQNDLNSLLRFHVFKDL